MFYRYNIVKNIIEFVNGDLTTGYWTYTSISKEHLLAIPQGKLEKVVYDPNWLATRKQDAILFTVREHLTNYPQRIIYTLLPNPKDDSKYTVHDKHRTLHYDLTSVELYFAIGAWIPL